MATKYAGDTIEITAQVKDSSGALTDASSVTVTITLPDLTTVGPTTMTHASTGVYTSSYVSAQAGMHVASFAVTGGGSGAGAGMVTFYVEPIRAGLVTEEEARAHLRISTATYPTYQDRIRLWIQSSRELIEGVTGRLTLVAQDDWMDGGAPTIMVLEPPIASMTAVTETFGANIVRTLTLQPIDGSGSVTAFGYTVDDYVTGKLTRRVTGLAAPFALGRNNVRLKYNSGVAGEWHPNIRLANLELLRLWWVASQDGSNPAPVEGPPYDEPAGALVGELPPRVIRMLGRGDDRAWGSA